MRPISPLWTSAPSVLLHFRALFVAVAAAAVVLALAVTAAPLLLSASASNAVQDAIEDVTTYGAGVTIVEVDEAFTLREGDEREPTYVRADALLRERAARIPHLGERQLALLSRPIGVAARPGGRSLVVRLLAKTEALDHVTKLETGGPPDGVWLSNTTADELGLDPGEPVSLGSVELPVAGVYKTRFLEPATPYWSSLYTDIYPRCVECPVPPPFAIVERDRLLDMVDGFDLTSVEQHWQFPLENASALTLEGTRDVIAELDVFEDELFSGEGVGEEFLCATCRTFSDARIDYSTSLPEALELATSDLGSVQGPTRLMSIAGTIVAAAVVAAAGFFLNARRKTEFAWLYARGFSPARVGIKVWLEGLLPVVVGIVLGSALTLAVVRLFSRGNPVDARAIGTAALLAAVSIPAAAALIAAVTAALYGRDPTRARKERWWSSIPAELVFVAIAGWSFKQLTEDGGLVGGAESTPQASLHLSLFPLTFIAVIAGFGARAAVAGLRGRGGRGSRSQAFYLATRRMGAAPGLVRMLLTSCAVALGVFAYSHALVGSIDRSMFVKSEMSTGSDVSAIIRGDQEPDPDLGFPVTKVAQLQNIRADDGRAIDVVGIDPSTFRDAAFWDRSFASPSLDELIRVVSEPVRDGPVPVILVGSQTPTQALDVLGVDIPVEIVAEAESFPGMSTDRPLVVATIDNLQTSFDAHGAADPLSQAGIGAELWVRGDPQAVSAALQGSNSPPYDILTAEEIRNSPEAQAVTATFSSLRMLGAGVGILSAIGLLLYLQARQRARVLSNALAARMGLGRRDRVLALLFEIGTLLTFASVAGGVAGVLAARSVLAHVDPRPDVAPGPLFEPSLLSLLVLGVALVAFSLVGGVFAHKRSEKTDVAAVMRVA